MKLNSSYLNEKKNVYFELRSRLLQWQYHVSVKSWKDRRWKKIGLQI